MRSKLFFLILILALGVPFSFSAPDEGYGEANDNLGQLTDTFQNEDYVAVLSDVIVNTTLECAELNFTSATKAYLDFDKYTEVDALNRLTQGDTFSNWTSMSRTDDNIYLYRDYGADYFDDFIHEFELYMDHVPAYGTPLVLVMVTSYTDGKGDWIALRSASTDQIAVVVAPTNNEAGYRIQMRESFSGSDENTLGAVELDEDTTYYLRVIKNGTMWRALVYSDFPRTVLVENVTLTLDADHKLRYHLPPQSPDFPTSAVHTGYINNFWAGNYTGGYETEGYLITEDYLNYTQGESLTLLTNASLPPSTGMTVSFSSDNVTWVDNHGVAGASTVRANFSALDLRDLNYKDIFMNYTLTGPGEDVTPRLYQSRLVTTEGVAGTGDVLETDFPWVAIAIILSLISALLFMRKR